ncbi:response regulator [Algoriphagus namhaensis]
MVKVVLIDDDPISTFVTEKLIEKNVHQPVQFFKFSSAKEALEEIGKLRPQYLFLDLNMPEMDGWDFLDSLNGQSVGTNIYILSSSVDERDIVRARAYKMVKDYLSKPLIKKSITSIFN